LRRSSNTSAIAYSLILWLVPAARQMSSAAPLPPPPPPTKPTLIVSLPAACAFLSAPTPIAAAVRPLKKSPRDAEDAYEGIGSVMVGLLVLHGIGVGRTRCPDPGILRLLDGWDRFHSTWCDGSDRSFPCQAGGTTAHKDVLSHRRLPGALTLDDLRL